tara:strand:- start:545 stop:1519 length:975 start_codon:yes stop_codon:yes gene_type:complete
MKTDKQKRVVIIDALNMYYRAYIVDPSLSTNGQPIGGIKGFLKILQKLIRETKPDSVVVIWDGPGGSQKRKIINKNYKEGRKPIRLNRDVHNLTENEEVQNKVWQQMRLMEYLNQMPIIQLMQQGIEADDIIAYVAQSQFKGWQKVIVSSDKDFYQLCDGETVVHRPIQHETLNVDRIIDKHGIHPTNFALARAIAGDKSDNLVGVPGVGLPTVAKRFKFLSEGKTHTIDSIVSFCKSVERPLKVHRNIPENVDVIKENYKIMQLYSPAISVQTKQKISNITKNFVHEFNQTQVKVMMAKDGFGTYNWDSLFTSFKKIILGHKQ